MLRNGHAREPMVEILVTKPLTREDPPPDPPPDPGDLSWIQTFSNHLARQDTPRKRLQQMDGVHRDLERMITALARSPAELPATSLEGLQQRLEQAQQIADSPASCSAFEINIFWLLLEQEVHTVKDRLQQLEQSEALGVGWAMAAVTSRL